jgi:KAP family P-loop domain
MHQDPDFDWLSSHLPQKNALPERQDLAERIAVQIAGRVNNGDLPHTLGVFGGWGSGKTTFLALLAEELNEINGARIIYFNSWKYAGLADILPSLIYKILQQGVPPTNQNRNKAAMRVLASLGKEYSDKLGSWTEERTGVNPAELFKDVQHLYETVKNNKNLVRSEVLKEYYTQVDKAQDALVEALHPIEPGKRVENPIIILIDELDRCDPDEAFIVIKQLRVLFAMRRLPTVFVLCANPEPIGLAIKHRYGLESEAGDYEARRILEKFVDAYEDFSEPVALGNLARTLWKEAGPFPTPWIIAMDEANHSNEYVHGPSYDITHNTTVFDMMNSSIPHYGKPQHGDASHCFNP